MQRRKKVRKRGRGRGDRGEKESASELRREREREREIGTDFGEWGCDEQKSVKKNAFSLDEGKAFNE